MEYIFAYLAGLLTLINPCVVPVLPIVLASALQTSRKGPLALAAGMSLAFVVVGVGVTAFGRLIGLDAESLGQVGAVMMVGFGIVLLVPQGGRVLSLATAGLAQRADANMNALPYDRLHGQFAGGLLLGAVWSPCIGPTLGGAIALASQGQSLGHVTGIMAAFALGVSSFLLAIAYSAQGLLARHGGHIRALAQLSKPLLGLAFVLVGTGILLGWHHLIEGWLISVMPAWLIDLSVVL